MVTCLKDRPKPSFVSLPVKVGYTGMVVISTENWPRAGVIWLWLRSGKISLTTKLFCNENNMNNLLQFQ